LTYSKTFFLTLLLLVLIYLLWQFWNKRVFKGILMTLTILLLGGILLLSEGSPFAVVLTRLTNSMDLGDLTTGRSDVFMQYFRVITQSLGNVLVGVGLGQPGLGQDPHNLYLEIVYYVGLTGLVLMGVYYVALIRAIDADLKQQNFIARYIVLFMVMVFHFTLHGMTTLTAYASFFMAALAMLIIPKEETPCQD
jgi:O-antigen ligase